MAITAGIRLPVKRYPSADGGRSTGTTTTRWLITVSWAGRYWFLSRESYSVSGGPDSLSGETLVSGVLQDEIEWEDALTLFSDSADTRSLSFSAVFPDTDIAALVAQGHDLATATAELALCFLGGSDVISYRYRRVMLRGRLTDPTYGGLNEPLTATIQSEFFEDRALLPSTAQVVSTSTWSDKAGGTSAADGAIGAPYPVVFGTTPQKGVASTSMSIAHLVRTNAYAPGAEVLLVAGHLCDAGTVMVYSATDGAALGVSPGQDDLGNEVSIIGPGLGTLSFADDDTFTVVWGGANATATLSVLGSPVGVGQTITIGGVVLTATNVARTPGSNNFNGALGTAAAIATDIADALSDGANDFRDLIIAEEDSNIVNVTARDRGLSGNAITLAETSANTSWSTGTLVGGTDATGGLRRREGGPITGAGDLLEYLLRQSTVPVDWGRTLAAKQRLNAYRVAGVIAEPTSPFSFISANLSPILPMSLFMGPYGMYPIPWLYDATENDAVTVFDTATDASMQRASDVEYAGSTKDLINDFQLSYALQQRTGDMKAVASLSANRNPDDSLSAESLYCRRSELKYGKHSSTEESTVIYDPATAARVLGWWARAKALPSRRVRYYTTYDRQELDVGSVVILSDAEIALDKEIAIIESMVFREDAMLLITFRLNDNIAQKFHAAGA